MTFLTEVVAKLNTWCTQSLKSQVLVSAGVCLSLHVGRIILRRPLCSIARLLGARTEEDAEKFAVQTINCVFHGVSGVWLTYVIAREGWKETPKKIWALYGTTLKDVPSFYYLYCFETGYHLQRLVAVFGHNKKDFLEMLLHHSVTVGLLFSSMAWGYMRIGMTVLCVHDVSDVFGCLSKMAKCCQKDILAICAFLPTLGMWAYTRLYLLPFHVIPAAMLCPGSVFSRNISVAGLWTLVGLNAYWYAIFLKIITAALTSKGKNVKDMQEDTSPGPSPTTQMSEALPPSPHNK